MSTLVEPSRIAAVLGDLIPAAPQASPCAFRGGHRSPSPDCVTPLLRLECGFLRMNPGCCAPIIGHMTSTAVIPSRVLLADVAGPARRALAELLGGLDGVLLVGEAGRDDLARTLRSVRPDVLVIDDRMIRDGDATLPAGVRVIVVGVDDDPAFAARARALGAAAWVIKDRADEDLPALLAVDA